MQTAIVSIITFICGFIGYGAFKDRNWWKLGIITFIGCTVYVVHVYLGLTS